MHTYVGFIICLKSLLGSLITWRCRYKIFYI